MSRTFILSRTRGPEGSTEAGYTLRVTRRFFPGSRVVYSSGLESNFSPSKFGEIVANRLPWKEGPLWGDIITTVPSPSIEVGYDRDEQANEESLSFEDLRLFNRAYQRTLNLAEQGRISTLRMQT
jgi:hypothetical protein